MSGLDPRLAAAAAAIAVALGFALVLALRARLRRRAASRRAVTRARRAQAGEDAATALLEAAGYAVVDTQARLAWTIRCGGAPVVVELRCDAVVTRAGRRLIAEVKTGERAPSLATAATRRQLLEYALAYRADGVLLVDPEAGELHEVDFGLTRPAPPAPARLAWFVAGAAVGAALAASLLS